MQGYLLSGLGGQNEQPASPSRQECLQRQVPFCCRALHLQAALHHVPSVVAQSPLAGIPLSHPFTCITCSRWGQHSSDGLDCTQEVSVSSCSGWRDSSNSRRRWILLHFLIFMKSTGSIHHFICSISHSYPTCAVTNTPGKSTWHLPPLVNPSWCWGCSPEQVSTSRASGDSACPAGLLGRNHPALKKLVFPQ